MTEPTPDQSNRNIQAVLLVIVAFPFVLGAIGWVAVYEDEFKQRGKKEGKRER